ncbi:MAG: PAS domain-containing sensor histidine kinase [Methanobacterium sp.]
MFISIADGVVVYDKSANIVKINEVARNILGYGDEELKKPLKERAVSVLHPNGDHFKFDDLPVNRALKGEIIRNVEMIINNDSDDHIWVNASAAPIRNKNSEIEGAVSTFTDINERKKAEEKLIENKNKLETVIESMNDAVFISDTEGNFINFNEAFATYHKFKNKEEAYKALHEYPDYVDVCFPDGTFAPLDMWAVPRALRGEIVSNAEYILRRKDTGEKWWGSYSFGPIRDNEGKIIGSVVVGRDITKIKKAEKELRDAHDTLEEQVKERTSELSEAIMDLERSNTELQQFAYAASHDLQEPLRTIASFTQLLERRYKGKLDSDADEFMDYIVDAARRMQNQIKGLLRYSRVTSGGEEFRLINTKEIVKETIDDFKLSIKENEAVITCDNLPDVCADERLLTQVFQNLIGNAIKYRKPEESPLIHISARKDEEKSEYVFSVSDNGIGIDSQYFDRIFMIFQRLHTREKYEGTGIGLAIVKKIIDRHGGHIWVESESGKGSTFYFTIPIRNCN